jgi:DNA-directed RNA polymerase specialized sigma24 family protein
VTTTLQQHHRTQSPQRSQMDNRDEELQQLALAIQASPNRQDRVIRKQINQLITTISTRLQGSKRWFTNRWSGIVDIEVIFGEAVTNTLLEVAKNIDSYDPEYSVIQWATGILHFRFLDVLRKYRARYESISFDNTDAMAEAKIAEMSEPESDLMTSELYQFIKADPDGHFLATHIRNHPDATLQRILLMRLDGFKWKEIADRLNISSLSTINNFSDRQLRNLNNYFRKYLRE